MTYSKKIGKKFFKFFFSKKRPFDVRTIEKKFCDFFKFSKILFEKWPQWDITNVKRNKVMKFELNWTVH